MCELFEFYFFYFFRINKFFFCLLVFLNKDRGMKDKDPSRREEHEQPGKSTQAYKERFLGNCVDQSF